MRRWMNTAREIGMPIVKISWCLFGGSSAPGTAAEIRQAPRHAAFDSPAFSGASAATN